jgi:hypothetical protein
MDELSVREIVDEEPTEITEAEARKRFRKLAWEQPDFNFSILEALMDSLDIPKEKQREIINEGARKWQQV